MTTAGKGSYPLPIRQRMAKQRALVHMLPFSLLFSGPYARNVLQEAFPSSETALRRECFDVPVMEIAMEPKRL